jgi:hypothetical protein
MDETELLARAVSLKAETQRKLTGWRLRTTNALLAPIRLSDGLKVGRPGKDLLRQAVAESLDTLNGQSENVYYRMRLVGRQLGYLVTTCLVLVVAALWASSHLVPPDPKFGRSSLVAIALAGALGGVVSAMYQLNRVAEARIPVALLNGLITIGRPFVGAAAALFAYVVMESGLIGFIDPAQVSLPVGLGLGFVAGFSERFVLSIVARVASRDKDDSGQQEDTGLKPQSPDGAPGGRPAAPAQRPDRD